MNPEVILASHNPGKFQEFRDLLATAPFAIKLYPSDQEIVEETGGSYADNARLKAHYVAGVTKNLALADDSGIEVDALDGLPGVHSARFVSSEPWENSREILLRLIAVPRSERGARMRAVLCLAWPDGREILAEGVVEGSILGWPRGQFGFGVDPVFSVDGKTSLAEWKASEKNQISHRARAVSHLLARIAQESLLNKA